MKSTFSAYYDEVAIAAAVSRGDHRELVGGMWDEIGALQMCFLTEHGLVPQSTLLDIGCGSLRLGVRAVEYLDPGNYWGTDLGTTLLDAGYEREIVPAGNCAKLPRSHLVADAGFTFAGIPRAVDFAIAASVFTHLPLNHLRLCLANLGRHVASPCTFFFTVFGAPSDFTKSRLQQKGGVVTYPDRDPYHYSTSDLYYATAGTAWTIELIGDWDHPRNQLMVKAHKG